MRWKERNELTTFLTDLHVCTVTCVHVRTHTHTYTARETNTETERHTERQTKTEREIERHTERPTEKDREAEEQFRHLKNGLGSVNECNDFGKLFFQYLSQYTLKIASPFVILKFHC